MAYNQADRFPPDPKYYRFYDPCTYQHDDGNSIKPSKVPFLSNRPRLTQPGRHIWTHAIYNADYPPKIPNCTAMMSKIPRFPYEALSKEGLEDILCRCGIEPTCECPVEDNEVQPEIICQGKIRRYLIIGPTPKRGDNGLSAPSKGDHGFQILPDGTKRRLKDEILEESPPFYDARVIEATAFYHGWKWSKWSGKRQMKSLEERPGPADYSLERQPTYEEICAEKVRAFKSKTSKQYRYIEMVQRRNTLEGAPGPATYTPKLPKGTDLHQLGPKADRFPSSKYDVHPSPADYSLKRAFDLPDPPDKQCHAVLPEPACFGMKAQRFKPRKEEGPSPASYCPSYKPCRFLTCPKTPFGSGAPRFKADKIEEDEDEFFEINEFQTEKPDVKEPCPTPTWEFRSKTVRMKPCKKRWQDPSPADFAQSRLKPRRSVQMQYLAPFLSSEGRFQPWYNWMPVLGKYETPGPCYYSLERPKSLPAVNRGPLCRSRRFPVSSFQSPAPNEYDVGGGLENILATHNKRLKDNIKNQHKFHWTPPPIQRKLTFEEQETVLLNKCIALCEVEPNELTTIPKDSIKTTTANETGAVTNEKGRTKMLRYFLYSHKQPVTS